MTRLRTGLACGLLLAACACPGCTRPGDVLLLSIDTLRPDHLGLYGYARATSPNLDRWFGGGAIYERACTTEANTSPAVVSMLSGVLPQEHRVRLLHQLATPGLALLPDLLPAAYQTSAVVQDMVLADEALVIFTADHGESMLEHERWFTRGYHVYEEIARVPLMVRGPGVTPGRRRGLASLVDVAPTMLRFAGAPVPRALGYVE